MLIIGNFKSYVSRGASFDVLIRAMEKIAKKSAHTLVVAPSLLHVGRLGIKKRSFKIAAQDVSVYGTGAYTGEVSAEALKDSGVEYVIVGHSERRAMGEEGSIIAKKIEQVLAAGLRPIICIGEASRDEHATYLAFLANQIVSALDGVSEKDFKKVIIAYEPLWAIGKRGKAITAELLEETILFLRKTLLEHFGEHSRKTQILYGGSVDAASIASIGIDHVDGLLIGGASAQVDSLEAVLSELS